MFVIELSGPVNFPELEGMEDDLEAKPSLASRWTHRRSLH